MEIKVIAATTNQRQESSYIHNGVEVYRYPVDSKFVKQPNQPQIIYKGFDSFESWLKRQQADIYHQHHWETTCGVHHLRLAKKLGLKTVVTLHYPLPICQRNTLMLYGNSTCDGKIDIARCSKCSDRSSKRIPDQVLQVLSQLPASAVSRFKLPESTYLPSSSDTYQLGSLIRSAIIPSFIASRQKNLQQMAQYADRIIVVCNWLYQSLLINDISAEKLILSRHGIAYNIQNVEDWKMSDCSRRVLETQERSLKLVFLGRYDISKGLDILIKAIKNLPSEINIKLFIHAIAQDKAYYQKILKLAKSDSRIHVERQLSREELSKVIRNYDLLVVPSQWLETGPLVVLEAHANGLPVIGSNLGGIAELIKDGENGLLVQHDDINAWSEIFKRLYFDENLLKKLQQGIQPVRHIKEQASDIAQIYNQINN